METLRLVKNGMNTLKKLGNCYQRNCVWIVYLKLKKLEL
jgi:hypothetical protein